jgi:hypothetical protein
MKYLVHQEGKLILLFFFLEKYSSSFKRAPSAAQRGQGTLIVESKDSRDNDINDDNDDEDANFLVQEEKPSVTKSFVCKKNLFYFK